MKTCKIDFKKNILPYLLIVALFAAAACIYCYPSLQGKVLVAGDSVSGQAAVQEAVEYTAKTGNTTWWTGSMFAGMPNYQIGGGEYAVGKILKPVYALLHGGGTRHYLTLFFYLIAFFVLMRAFGISRAMSVAGAFAVSLSSYFLIIIGAAHGGKTMAITYMTLVLVGMVLIYKKKYGWGSALTMFFIIFGLPIHPQMAYYICMLMGLIWCAELYIHIKEKRMKDWAIATAIFVVSFAIGFGVTSANTFANSEYLTQTMRGGHSDLDGGSEGSKGLDIDYATSWSYGIDETLTFLVPNYMGAASGYNVGRDSRLYDDLVRQGVDRRTAEDFCSAVPVYWGDQPFTAGPVYMGAIVCFLFVLGLFLVRGPYKWALVAATLFSVALSWGYHFMPLTSLFFKYFPLYNKFRAVSSILIVAEITVPLLGFMAIKEICSEGIDMQRVKKSIYWSAGITGGICLVLALFGKVLCSFISPNDAQFASQLPDWAYHAIIDQRATMLVSDSWRSLLFIVAGAAVIWLFASRKLKELVAATALCILIVADMWLVDKRFYNDSNYQTPRQMSAYFAMQPYEEEILSDRDPHFRVMNLAANTFNDARTSYYLKSVGGYSAVKLRRYQDIIDQHLSQMHMPVINMLNVKYLIAKTENGIVPVPNPDAMGNAWFVTDVLLAGGPDEECAALNEVDLSSVAVVDRNEFGSYVEDFVPGRAGQISLTEYAPDYIEYDCSSADGGTVVFSEIYYPFGWKAYVDGKPAEHFRADYTLRAMNVPAGDHHIRFEFRPDSIRKGNVLSICCLIAMFAIMGGFMASHFLRKK